MTPRDSRAVAAHLDDDIGIDLIHGLAPAPVLAEWIEHLRACPPCEARFRELAETYERGRSHYARSLLSAASGGGLQLVPANPPSASSQIPTRLWWLGLGLAAAAALLLVFGPTRINTPRLPLDRQDQPWLPVGEADVRLRSDGAALDESLRLGLAAYNQHDLATARRILESVRPTGGAELLRRVYLADVLARQGEASLVIATLEPLSLSGLPDPWRSRAYRSLLLALESTGERDRADALRARLADDPGEIGDHLRSLGATPPGR